MNLDIEKLQLHEVGPREGFQFEGIGDPDRIPTARKVELITALASTGLTMIQAASFVHPKIVPQMADAEEISEKLPCVDGVQFTAAWLNDRGWDRAVAAGKYTMTPRIFFTASETFSLRNQRRTHAQDVEAQLSRLERFAAAGTPITAGSVMAAFGCNFEGDISLEHLIGLVTELDTLMRDHGGKLEDLELADTMGWADPWMIKRTLTAVWDRWPRVSVSLHLHDTRGLGMANLVAGMQMGVTRFDTSVGGLGGCPFAGVAAGNVATEDVVFLCDRLGVETGVDLAAITECARLAESVVGHELPSRQAQIAKVMQGGRRPS